MFVWSFWLLIGATDLRRVVVGGRVREPSVDTTTKIVLSGSVHVPGSVRAIYKQRISLGGRV